MPNLRKKLLGRFVVNVNPDIVTLIALMIAVLAGIMFYKGALAIAVFLLLLNGFLDILDGEIAKRYKRTTKMGDFLDHTADRLADVSILLGITLSQYVHDTLGYALIIVTLLTSYLGTQAQAITKQRAYGGLIGRADRIMLVAIFTLAEICYPGALEYGIILLLVLTVVTFAQRFVHIFKVLR